MTSEHSEHRSVWFDMSLFFTNRFINRFMGCVRSLLSPPPFEGHQRAVFARQLWQNGEVSFFLWRVLQSSHTIPKIGDHLLLFGWHGKSTTQSQLCYQSLGRMCKHHLQTRELITCHYPYYVHWPLSLFCNQREDNRNDYVLVRDDWQQYSCAFWERKHTAWIWTYSRPCARTPFPWYETKI